MLEVGNLIKYLQATLGIGRDVSSPGKKSYSAALWFCSEVVLTTDSINEAGSERLCREQEAMDHG